MRRWLAIAALLLSGVAFADIPTGEGYISITLPAPDASVSDQTILVDLGDQVLDAAWVAQWDTNLNGYGRATKGDGTTELATDWVASDYTNETGQVYILWSGAWSGTGNVIRLWPPNSGRTQYAAADTYGQYAAYASTVEGFWPCSEASGDLIDRTSTQLTLADTGTPTYGTAGQVGKAITFGSGDYFDAATAVVTTAPHTLVAWIKPADTTTNSTPLWVGKSTSTTSISYLSTTGGAAGDYIDAISNYGANYRLAHSSIGAFSADNWYHVVGVFPDANSRTCYANGANAGTESTGTTITGYNRTIIGAFITGSAITSVADICQVSAHSAALSAAAIEENYEQGADNAGYFAAFTYTAVAGSGLPVIERLFVACAN